MTKNVFSIIVRYWYDPQTDATRLQVMRTDTAEEVLLDSSSFLVRISVDETAKFERCLIRHIASGREIYVQSGPGLQSFIKSFLFADQR